MVNHFSTGNRLPSVSFLDSLPCGMFSAVLELKALSIKVAELLDPMLRYRYYNLRISYCVLVTFDFNSRFFAIFDAKNELFHARILYPGQNNFRAEKTAEFGIDFVLLRF